MPYDIAIPDGDKALSLVDDDHRANAGFIQGSINKEHDFVNASATNQSGRHKFKIDTKATIEAESEYVDGSIAIATNAGPFSSTKRSLSWKDAGLWVHQFPVYSDENVDRSKSEWGRYTSLASVTPIVWDWNDSHAFKITLTAATSLLQNPAGNALTDGTDRFGTWLIEVTQDGTGGRLLTYDSKFFAGLGGNVIPIDLGINARSIIYCTLMADGNILVNVLPDVVNIP